MIERINKYENLGLGLFIHWGLYSTLEKGEWTELIHEHRKEQYESLSNTFTGEDFDSDKIVRLAKKMGAKYITLTTKHHEGFFLYDTKGLSDFDITKTPNKRDFVREFVNSCKKYGIEPFLYMATYDWHSESYTENFNNYLLYLEKSVEILCKNYGEISGFWFDGNWNKKDADWKLDSLYKMIRLHQPNALIINNTGLKNRGTVSHKDIDVLTYERKVPTAIDHYSGGDGKYRAGETCLTMNDHWGVAKTDINYKSIKEILSSIISARCKGLNTLLNIGLDGKGNIPVMNQAYMESLSIWFKENPDIYYSIKETNVYSLDREFDFIAKGKNSNTYYYAFLSDLKIKGNENVLFGGETPVKRSFIGIPEKVKQICWVDNNEILNFSQENDALDIYATGFDYGSNLIYRVAKIEVYGEGHL